MAASKKGGSCPGRGAASFTLLRRAGTQTLGRRSMDPGSAAQHFVPRCVRGTPLLRAGTAEDRTLASLQCASHGVNHAAGQKIDGGFAAELVAGAALDQPR